MSPRRRGRRRTSELYAELTVALHLALAVDQVLLFEVGQEEELGDTHVMRVDGGEEAGYVHILAGRPSGIARVMTTAAPFHLVDAPGSTELRPDLVERFGVESVLFVPLAWGGAVRHVAISIFRTRAGADRRRGAARPRARRPGRRRPRPPGGRAARRRPRPPGPGPRPRRPRAERHARPLRGTAHALPRGLPRRRRRHQRRLPRQRRDGRRRGRGPQRRASPGRASRSRPARGRPARRSPPAGRS